jgi:aryl-alcohol dehydrogenase-like predicted oxidoreductase
LALTDGVELGWSVGPSRELQRRPRHLIREWTTTHIWIVPIPGTTKLSGIEENIGAVDVELTPDDLYEIEDAASKTSIQGARYPEALEARTVL